MSTATFSDVRQILRKWDKGSKRVRELMLVDLVNQCESMTAPALEQYFNDCGSLFLARLTAWLRLTYITNQCLEVLLRATSTFVTATSGQHFLTEFLEVGGMLTLLEIISLKTTKDRDKAEGLRLLTAIAIKGRQYKELLCESFGTKLVAECLALSSSEETQECARNLLHHLCSGNPRYQSQVYNALISLLSSTSYEAQKMAAYTLRQVQDSMDMVSGAIVDPVLQLLKTLHIDLQQEALELLSDLVSYEEVQQPIFVGLVAMLKHEDAAVPVPKALHVDGTVPEPLPNFVQQAAAARSIRMLLAKYPDLGSTFVELRAIPHLLYALGNTAHADSQKQASFTLAEFLKKYSSAQNQVQTIIGNDFYHALIKSPETLYSELSPSQIDVLVGSLGQERN